MKRPIRHIWEEGSVHRSVAGEEYDKVWDYAEQLEADLAEARNRAMAAEASDAVHSNALEIAETENERLLGVLSGDIPEGGMMTYEQFLKQLRRIGRQMMLCSVLAIIGLLIFEAIIGERLSDLTYAILIAMTTTGLMIYPFRSEE